MSVATATAREVHRDDLGRTQQGPNVSSLVFLGLLWFSLFFGVMVLLVLIVDTAIEGSARFDSALLTNYISGSARRRPGSAPASSAACG